MTQIEYDNKVKAIRQTYHEMKEVYQKDLDKVNDLVDDLRVEEADLCKRMSEASKRRRALEAAMREIRISCTAHINAIPHPEPSAEETEQDDQN